jgi:DNA-binding FadR family transcriptional regulator
MADGADVGRTERSYELVARALEQQILDQQLTPGAALPPELTLAAQLGVNRSTLREALRALEQNGLISREAGRKKLRVTLPQPKDIARRVTTAMLIHQVTFRELYEGLRALEPACAAAAAERADDADIALLEDNLARTRAAVETGASLVVLDIEFHQLVARAAQSRALELARTPLGELFYPAFDKLMSRLNVADRLLVAHAKIVDAIRGHDAATGRAWMERHIEDFRRGCELTHIEMNTPVARPPSDSLGS